MKPHMSRRWLVVALLTVAALLHVAAMDVIGQQNPDPSRFEKDIKAFEADDVVSPPTKGAVLFVGSSTMRYWDTAKAFPNLTTIKRGFGGSHVSDNIYFADRIIVPYKPKLIVFYAGDADVASDKTADQIFSDFKTFISMIHAKLPGTPMVIIGIKPSPAHWKQIEAIRKTNALVGGYVGNDRLVRFIDVSDRLIGADGRPQAEFYAENGLNLSESGYAVWTSAVRALIEDSQKD
jgi:lysophospholipase L1-like esterase